MAENRTEVSGRPVGGRGRTVLRAAWFVAIASGLAAVAMGAIGWHLHLRPDTPEGYLDVAIRAIKVLLLSDIYYADPAAPWPQPERPWLEWARALGVVASLTITIRLLLLAMGSRLADWLYRITSSRHDVIIGSGPAAQEYAAAHGRMFKRGRAIHLDEQRLPAAHRLATFQRRGPLTSQLRQAVAHKARRVVVDEGDDADTWQTAQAVARRCPRADVLAHITDPWIRDQLSREQQSPRLVPFSYAGGAARQVMLAHPPYLLARNLGAGRQHILVVGFGQVGQSLAREFIATSVISDPPRMMVTVVDPEAAALETDFRSRHSGLVDHVDFCFIKGDFRTNADALAADLGQRNASAPICAVYVAIDLDHRPLSLAFAVRALALRQRIFRAPIFVCAQHGAGLAPVSQGAGLVGGPPDAQSEQEIEEQALVRGALCNLRVVSFGDWPAAFDGAGLLEPDMDGQARRYHEAYLRVTPGADSLSWRDLPDQLRVSNRRAAAHLRAKAFVAGFDIDAWLAERHRPCHELPPAAGAFGDDPASARAMARLEHMRWMLDRLLDGWRLGENSNYYRQRDTLIPFDDLRQHDVDKDIAVVHASRDLMGLASGRRRRR